MSSLIQDLRQSLRLLVKSPGFTTVAVLTLALALGANTAVFSVMNGVLLRVLPYPDSGRIVDVSILMPASGGQPEGKALLDPQRLDAWQARTRSLEELAAYRTQLFTLSHPGDPERLAGASVSPSLFSLLRVVPAVGRTFDPAEQKPGSDRVVVLSYELWQRRFQGDARLLGTAITLDGEPHTVIGVMPEGFFFPTHGVDLWKPLALRPPIAATVDAIQSEYLPAVARLKDGASLVQAETEAEEIFRRLPSADGPLAGKVRLVPLREAMVAGVRPALLVVSSAVGLVLLIACVNVTNLLLARSSTRRREMAIRSAMGGGRGRLVRQMLTESTVLSLAGGIAGMLVAGWTHHLLLRLLPREIPRLEDIQLDARVFLFAFALSLVTGLLLGLPPALRGARPGLVQDLHGAVAEPPQGSRSRDLLVVAEVALACVLLVGAGLLVRSFLHLMGIEPGYEPDHVLTATIDLDPARYGAPGQTGTFCDELLDRLQKNGKVQAAGIVSFAPLAPGFSLTSLEVVGQPPGRTLAVPQMTSPGYMEAIGLRLSEGRWLTAQDHAMEAPVAVVNETFVRRHIQGPAVLGRRLNVGSASLKIVGVIQDVRLLGLSADPKPELFTSYRHAEAISGASPERMTLVIRTREDPLALVPTLRTLVLSLDPGLVLEDVGTMNNKLSASVAQPRFYAILLAAFAALSLMLASAGVYGVLSYSVARQTHSIGVRRALGAVSGDILAMVLRKGVALVLLGLGIGLAAAAGATRLLAGLLFGLTATDLLSYVLAALALVAAALLACYLPARRAMLIDPMEAIRYE